MAIQTAMANNFKRDILKGLHDLTSDTIKIALIASTHTGTYDATTNAYADVTSNSDEIANTGSGGNAYTAGGVTLDSGTVSLDGSTAICDFANETITNATISASGAIIYNTTIASSDDAICVLNFGGTKTSTNGDFAIQFPAADASNAVIRIA